MKHIVKSIGFIAILALLAGCSGGYKPPPPAPLVAFAPTLRVQQLWENSSSDGLFYHYLRLTPALSNGAVYTGSYNGRVVAVNAATGSKIWKVNAKVPITSGLTTSAHKIFFGTGNGVLLALSQQNGKVLWWGRLNGEILAAPAYARNIVVVKVDNGVLAAFNSATGKRLWLYKHQEPSLILRGSGSPQIAGNKVIAGFADGKLVALNLYNGRRLWQRQIATGRGETIVQRMVDIDVTPKISRGVAYVATYQGRLAAVRISTGQVLWQRKISSYTGLALDNNAVYISTATGDVLALQRTSGRVIWKQEALAHRSLTAPALVAGYVVVVDVKGYAHFMAKADGHFVARMRVDRYGVLATPVATQNNVYIYSNVGRLFKLAI